MTGAALDGAVVGARAHPPKCEYILFTPSGRWCIRHVYRGLHRTQGCQRGRMDVYVRVLLWIRVHNLNERRERARAHPCSTRKIDSEEHSSSLESVPTLGRAIFPMSLLCHGGVSGVGALPSGGVATLATAVLWSVHPIRWGPACSAWLENR